MDTTPIYLVWLGGCLGSVGLILVICAWCKRPLRIQRARGTKTKGISHGMCDRCAREWRAHAGLSVEPTDNSRLIIVILIALSVIVVCAVMWITASSAL